MVKILHTIEANPLYDSYARPPTPPRYGRKKRPTGGSRDGDRRISVRMRQFNNCFGFKESPAIIPIAYLAQTSFLIFAVETSPAF
jgi:hypothetical protein